MLLFLVLVACSVKKYPIFIKVDAVKITGFSSDTIRLKAAVFFENPTLVKGKISTDEISVFANGVEVAQVFSEEFKVPTKDKFSVPISVKIPIKHIINTSKNNLLEGFIKVLSKKSMNIRIKGSLVYMVYGFKKEILIDKVSRIKF